MNRQGLPCEHRDHQLVRRRMSNGALGVLEWCNDCARQVSTHFGRRGVWISQDELRRDGVVLEDLPTIGTAPMWRTCEGPCRRFALCEEHHYGPREHFGDRADEWPIAWLCDTCHGEWHLRMGRNIGRHQRGQTP